MEIDNKQGNFADNHSILNMEEQILSMLIL